MSEKAKCGLCGEPMPEGEEMFNYHGYSGPCPAPPAEPVVEKSLDPHFVSASCGGEFCKCGRPATHKVGEEIPWDDPYITNRHNFTKYVCCGCFRSLMGDAVFCEQPAEPPAVRERADGWIPVDERQPDSDRLIWVMEQFGDGGEFTNFESTWGFYRKGKWLSYSHGELGESDYVRFWQEAPVPPARETIQSQ